MEKKAVPYFLQLKWIARGLLSASAVGIALCSYLLYSPNNTPYSFANQQIGQLLAYGGTALALAVFAWISPGAGGIISMLYGLVKLLRFGTSADHFSVLTHIPPWAYIILYGVFTIGAFLCIVASLQKGIKKPPVPTRGGIRLLWTARIAAFTPIVLAVIMVFIEPLPFVLGVVPGLITLGIAWFWPGAGGLLMLLLSGPGFYALFQSNWDFGQKLPYYIFDAVFFISGTMHIIYAFLNWLHREK